MFHKAPPLDEELQANQWLLREVDRVPWEKLEREIERWVKK